MPPKRRKGRLGPFQHQPPFNSDRFIYQEFERLTQEFGVKTLVETGTCIGNTTVGLAKLAPVVHTIELADRFFPVARQRLKPIPNVTLHQGNSPEVMDRILPTLERPVMFYLDAHWNDYWPLRDELAMIAKYGLQDSLIAIHDFQVPGKRWGFDRYKGQPLNLAYVQSSLDDIYGPGQYSHHYNTQVSGAKRGVLYVLPKGKG